MFIYVGNNRKIKQAVIQANSIVMSSLFFEDEVRAYRFFEMTEPEGLNGGKVFNDVRALLKTKDILIKVYYPWYRFSKAYGFFTTSRPFDINMNGYKLKRSISSMVGTLVHEAVHMADNLALDCSYGHGDNSSIGKSMTAPYAIGEIASKLSGNQTPNIENNTYRKRFSLFTWFKKLFI